MKVLFLGNDGEDSIALASYIRSSGDTVLYSAQRIDNKLLESFLPDIIVSYNYRFILRKEVFDKSPLGTINLHISYLPWNRGADPNFWSHADRSPAGVTIHYIDEGIDTGDIITQKEVSFSHDETLKTSYARLHQNIRELFQDTWPLIKNGRHQRVVQQGLGSYHRSKDKEPYLDFLKNGWDTPISLIQGIAKR